MSAPAQLGGKNVLIVHDQEPTRQSLKQALQDISQQIQVQESVDTNDAFLKAARRTFDLVIIEAKTAQIDGRRFLQRLVDELNETDRPKATMILADGLDMNTFSANLPRMTWIQKPLKNDELKFQLTDTLMSTIQKRVDAAFINPFIEGTLKVLKTTCNTDCAKEEVFVRKHDQMSGDISAIIAMVSPHFTGSMAISFEKKCFLDIVSKMLGETYTEVKEEIKDAAGEICNQVFGHAKTKLNEMGHKIQPAIPSVIAGDKHTIKHLVGGPCIAVRFKTSAGTFTIEAVIG